MPGPASAITPSQAVPRDKVGGFALLDFSNEEAHTELPMAEQAAPIGPQLRKLREQKQLTQQALAVAAGVSVSLVTQIEQGRTGDPRLSTLRALAGALGVSLDELAGKEG